MVVKRILFTDTPDDSRGVFLVSQRDSGTHLNEEQSYGTTRMWSGCIITGLGVLRPILATLSDQQRLLPGYQPSSGSGRRQLAVGGLAEHHSRRRRC